MNIGDKVVCVYRGTLDYTSYPNVFKVCEVIEQNKQWPDCWRVRFSNGRTDGFNEVFLKPIPPELENESEDVIKLYLSL